MKAILVFSAALAAAHATWAAQPLLTPAQLQPMLRNPDLRVIDIRDPQSFEMGHIEGAVNAPYGQWLGPAGNIGIVPELAALTRLVQSAGLTPSTHAVVVSSGVDAGDFGATARVYWTLKSLGLTELSILNGGMMDWDSEGEMTDMGPGTPVAPSQFAPRFNPEWLATRDEVKESLRKNSALLVDARPDVFYLGKFRAPMALVAGTLPGAKQLDFNQWFVPGTARFADVEKTRQVATQFQSTQNPQSKPIITFCNTGYWSATDWFAFSEILGRKDVRMYAGSAVDWTQSKEPPPMDNQPSRAESLAYDARQWWNRKFK